ncbi:hypothetical protein PR048_023302 [Dryococelus australis]|uniref:C2H2-type domain-containing protein n=1 Tax=Dryococelus australis TaxID=614101 RepID=A0ABQ9GTQ0_9NEOP|nr:hypothetical protein PR048_023302 [Dryococelus australis]
MAGTTSLYRWFIRIARRAGTTANVSSQNIREYRSESSAGIAQLQAHALSSCLDEGEMNEVIMEQRQNATAGAKRKIPEKTCRPAASSSTILTCENPGMGRSALRHKDNKESSLSPDSDPGRESDVIGRTERPIMAKQGVVVKTREELKFFGNEIARLTRVLSHCEDEWRIRRAAFDLDDHGATTCIIANWLTLVPILRSSFHLSFSRDDLLGSMVVTCSGATLFSTNSKLCYGAMGHESMSHVSMGQVSVGKVDTHVATVESTSVCFMNMMQAKLYEVYCRAYLYGYTFRTAGKLHGKQCCYCGKIFSKSCHAQRHERTACTKNPFRAIKHYDNGRMHLGSSTVSQQVTSSITPATSIGSVSADEYDEPVNAKNGTTDSFCAEEKKLDLEGERESEDDHENSIDDDYDDSDSVEDDDDSSTFLHISPKIFVQTSDVKKAEDAGRNDSDKSKETQEKEHNFISDVFNCASGINSRPGKGTSQSKRKQNNLHKVGESNERSSMSEEIWAALNSEVLRADENEVSHLLLFMRDFPPSVRPEIFACPAKNDVNQDDAPDILKENLSNLRQHFHFKASGTLQSTIKITRKCEAEVVLWSDYSHPTKANRVLYPARLPPDFPTWESYRTVPLYPHRLSRPRSCKSYSNIFTYSFGMKTNYPLHRQNAQNAPATAAFSDETPMMMKGSKYGAAQEYRAGERDIPDKTRKPAVSSGTIPTCKHPGGDTAGNRTRFALVVGDTTRNIIECSLQQLVINKHIFDNAFWRLKVADQMYYVQRLHGSELKFSPQRLRPWGLGSSRRDRRLKGRKERGAPTPTPPLPGFTPGRSPLHRSASQPPSPACNTPFTNPARRPILWGTGASVPERRAVNGALKKRGQG